MLLLSSVGAYCMLLERQQSDIIVHITLVVEIGKYVVATVSLFCTSSLPSSNEMICIIPGGKAWWHLFLQDS
jgi:hypothetical protein